MGWKCQLVEEELNLQQRKLDDFAPEVDHEGSEAEKKRYCLRKLYESG